MSCTKNGTRHYFIVLYLLKEKDFICISVFCQVLPASISFIRKKCRRDIDPSGIGRGLSFLFA